MGKRIVRKTPLTKRILSAPSDIYLQSSEAISLWDWDGFMHKAGNSIGIGLNVVYLLVKIYRDGAFGTNDELPPDLAQGGSEAFFWVIEWTIMLACLTNTVYLLNASKSYTLFQHPTKPNPSNPNWQINSPNARLVLVDVNPDMGISDKDSDSDSESGPPSTPLSRRIYDGLASITPRTLAAIRGNRRSGGGHGGDTAPTTPARNAQHGAREAIMEHRWVLNVWEPPKWGIRIFCWFSPPAAVILFNMNRHNWLLLLTILVMNNVTIYFLVQVFQDKLNDQTILHGELTKEYNKFVYTLPPYRRTMAQGVGGDEPWEKQD